MNTNKLMTGAAVAFAAFALYQFTKKPQGTLLASQPAQQQRDAGLQAWMNTLVAPDWPTRATFDYAALSVDSSGSLSPDYGSFFTYK